MKFAPSPVFYFQCNSLEDVKHTMPDSAGKGLFFDLIHSKWFWFLCNLFNFVALVFHHLFEKKRDETDLFSCHDFREQAITTSVGGVSVSRPIQRHQKVYHSNFDVHATVQGWKAAALMTMNCRGCRRPGIADTLRRSPANLPNFRFWGCRRTLDW